MPFNDIREYILRLEIEGELVRIKPEIDWDLEAGAIIRRSSEIRSALPLIEKIKDYPAGYSILGDPLNTLKRFAIATDQPTDLSDAEMYRRLMVVYSGGLARPIKPKIVSTGPCKENISKGDEVNSVQVPITGAP